MTRLTPPPTGAEAPTASSHHPVALRFLRTHFEHGGLDENGYRILHIVLQMFSEISLLLFPYSRFLHVKVLYRIELLSRFIASTFHRIGEHIDRHLKNAIIATRELPNLTLGRVDRRRHLLKLWRRRLRTLHEPSNNDVTLYRHFLAYFDTEVHGPFLQLHREDPEHNSWHMRDIFNHIRDCMVSLQENIEQANTIVSNLDTELTLGSWDIEHPPRHGKAGREQSQSNETNARRKANKADRPTTGDMLDSLDVFFENSEDASNNLSPASTQWEYDFAPGGLEGCSMTPRVFTRSFDELEESVKSLRLHKVKLSTVGDLDTDSAVKVKDFALVTPSLLPSPATLLERREALCTREPAWEQRVIGGQVVQSRRPHDRNRAQTVDERGGGLEAWLAEPPSPKKGLERAGSIYSRVLHRQQTL